MKRVAAVVLLLLCGPAGAQVSDGIWERAAADRDYRALQRTAAPCRDADRRGGPPHVINPQREALDLVRRMLPVDPARCPGVARAAYHQLRAWAGEIERSDADSEVLRLLYRAASEGLGAPADPALAVRIGRILWLFEPQRPRLSWSEEERWAFLLRPETLALLRGRLARRPSEVRVRALLGEIHLRRDGPSYDPAEAVRMLEASARSPAEQDRVATMLTDGTLVPIDYRRAARVWWRNVEHSPAGSPARLALLRIGRLAAAAARAPAERGEALRILAMAALDAPGEAAAARDAMRARLGRIPTAPLAPGDAERIAAGIGREFGIWGVSAPEAGQPRHRPLLLRGLIGPDGEIVLTEVAQSSGSPVHDLAAQFVWAEYGERVDLSATARGRFVWTSLPPVNPRYAIEPR